LKKITIFFLIIILIFTGCKKSIEIKTLESGTKVCLIVTKDFGNKVLYNKVLPYIQDQSVMELMNENLEIKTAYNGGFINSINGLKSGYTETNSKIKSDWFYYINGFLSQVGSLDYYLKPNDIVVWDYHDWSKKYVSSLVGAYPYDLINGYGDSGNGTEILYTDSFSNEASELKDYLINKGIKEIEEIPFINGQIENDNKNIIVIGLWKEIKSDEYINKMYKTGERTGVFFEINKTIKIFAYNNEVSTEKEKAAIITSFIKDLGTMTKLYLITGNSRECIKKALNIVTKDNENLKGKFSILTTQEGEIINFPKAK
jgi:hypothetical protein